MAIKSEAEIKEYLDKQEEEYKKMDYMGSKGDHDRIVAGTRISILKWVLGRT